MREEGGQAGEEATVCRSEGRGTLTRATAGRSEERAARAGSGRGGSGLARRRSLSWRGGETCRADALRGRAAPPGFTPSSAHGLNGQGP